MITRRRFLKGTGLSLCSFAIADKISASSNYVNINNNEINSPIRITGLVKSNEKLLEDVVVSDGLTVTRTNSNGRFEFLSDNMQDFVFISIPAGYQIPQNKVGTAKFYKTITADQNGEMYVEFELNLNTHNEEKHHFLLLDDPQTLGKEDIDLLYKEVVPDVKNTVAQLEEINLFGVACGDIMFDKLEYFPFYEKAVEQMGIPFFQVLGNHDLEILANSDEESSKTFKKYFGPAYYSFNKGKIHYVVLDDVFWHGGGYIGYINKIQLDWLSEDLKHVEKGSTVVVFAHIPIYCEAHKREGEKKPQKSMVVSNRKRLYEILKSHKSFILNGHTHQSEYLEDGNSEIHIGGAVCGAWWTGPICGDGTPKGYTIYAVNENEISWKYKSLGKELNYQMKLYPKNSIKEHKDAIVANIWSADKYWKVNWIQDGVKMGEMKSIVGKDPLAKELYEGDNLPLKHNWVEPANTSHLFIAKPSKNAKQITVEATDRWNNKYIKSIAL